MGGRTCLVCSGVVKQHHGKGFAWEYSDLQHCGCWRERAFVKPGQILMSSCAFKLCFPCPLFFISLFFPSPSLHELPTTFEHPLFPAEDGASSWSRFWITLPAAHCCIPVLQAQLPSPSVWILTLFQGFFPSTIS